MKKVFLVLLEDGTCAFSRVPGNAEGLRRTPNFKKKIKEPNNEAPDGASRPESAEDTGQAAA